MRKRRRILTGLLMLAVVSGSVLAVSVVDAAPQWRQRRWLGRPAIDPTIRDTVAFGQNRYSATRSYRPRNYSTRSYGVRPYRGRVYSRGYR